jgi:hypothetical protein
MKETLEEVAQNKFGLVNPILGKSNYRMGYERGLIEGAKWQQESTLEQIDQTNPILKGSTALVYKQERMYSEEEVLKILVEHGNFLYNGEELTLSDWFEQFKKK